MRKPFTLTDPCSNCPFRSDIDFYLTRERVEEIAESLRGGAEFTCHKTIDYGDEETIEGLSYDRNPRERWCAGALITMEKEEQPNQMMRIAERLGIYDSSRLNMDAPVFDSLDEWVESFDG